MKNNPLLAATFAGLLLVFIIAPASAFDDYQHFESKPSEDLHAALCNLHQYNQTIAPLLAKDAPSALDLVKIHEISYTLENALIQLQTDLKQMAADLEEVHIASETMKPEVVKVKGKAYLRATNALGTQPQCANTISLD